METAAGRGRREDGEGKRWRRFADKQFVRKSPVHFYDAKQTLHLDFVPETDRLITEIGTC
jgi:hypothetical protein